MRAIAPVGVVALALAAASAAPAPARAASVAPARPPVVQCECLERNGFAEVMLEASGPAVLTVEPGANGETLEQEGIRLRARLLCNPNLDPADRSNAYAAAGVPGPEIQLYSPQLVQCMPFVAATATDADDVTEFSGTFRGGGCVDHLVLYWAGVVLAEVPLRINSPDAGIASPGAVDAGDLAALSQRLGHPEQYSICFDYNEDDAVDAGDVAQFAQALGASCP